MRICGKTVILIFYATSDESCRRSGHGTYVDNDEVIASVAGVVERVNKLITVKAVRTRWATLLQVLRTA